MELRIYIRIILDTKFHLKQIILTFWTKLTHHHRVQ